MKKHALLQVTTQNLFLWLTPFTSKCFDNFMKREVLIFNLYFFMKFIQNLTYPGREASGALKSIIGFSLFLCFVNTVFKTIIILKHKFETLETSKSHI